MRSFSLRLIPFLSLAVLQSACDVGSDPQFQILDVSGTVLSATGYPEPDATVIIDGETAITNSLGRFTIEDVVTPYDVTIIPSGENASDTYAGLTRNDPVLRVARATPASQTATIAGTVPAAPSRITRVVFVSDGRSWETNADPSSGAYQITVEWAGTANTLAGRVFVLSWTPGQNGFPASYEGYGTRNLTVTDGEISANTDFSGAQVPNPPESSIAGTATRPATYEHELRALAIAFDGVLTQVGLQSGAPIADAFTYVVPNVTGARFTVIARASNQAHFAEFTKMGITAGANNIVMSLAQPPALTSPGEGSSDVDIDTPFLFLRPAVDGVAYILLTPASPQHPRYRIFSSSAGILLPELENFGIELPAGAEYTWSVAYVSPASSMNEVASVNFLNRLRRLSGDILIGSSAVNSFTTQ